MNFFGLVHTSMQIEPAPQQWPEPQQWQFLILNTMNHQGSPKWTFFFFFGLFFGLFLGPHPRPMDSQARGSNRSCSCRPTPESQQHGLPAASATYTTAHGNSGSLTHWVRPGVESASSWMLVGFVNHWTTMGTPNIFFLIHKNLLIIFSSDLPLL